MKAYQESAEFFRGLLADCVRSISEMQTLKAEILRAGPGAADENEKEEILLLLDEMIWEEIHAANRFREDRKQNLALADAGHETQAAGAGPQPV